MPMKLRDRKKSQTYDADSELEPAFQDGKDSHHVTELEKHHHDKLETRSMEGIRGDERSIAILLFLYVLQGIPLGLGSAVPLILTNLNVSYKQQAEFSFAFWPFSMKLLWAPIVDSCFIARFGRRKTWLVPVQYFIGVTMLLLSRNVDFYLGEADGQLPNVFILTCMFFLLNFLAATQDIAVDGWALTMLQRHNVGYASTCNAVGQTAGYFLGYVGYLALESYGILTLSDFLFFWGLIFLIATTLVAIFKHEKKEVGHFEGEDLDFGVVGTYKVLLDIITLPHMPALIVLLLTSKIGFSAADSVTSLKLIERGVSKDTLAMLAVPIIPIQIFLPWVISHYTAGSKPLNVFWKSMPPRLFMGLVYAWMVWVTPSFQLGDGSFPASYYIMVVATFLMHQVFLYCMFVSIMAFFAKISDPAVGGTYMTLLNTLTNLGGNWPATLALWWVDVLTVKRCEVPDVAKNSTFPQYCNNAEDTARCQEGTGGKCVTEVEGYYIESIACVVIGFLWLGCWGWKTLMRLQTASDDEWRVAKTTLKRK